LDRANTAKRIPKPLPKGTVYLKPKKGAKMTLLCAANEALAWALLHYLRSNSIELMVDAYGLFKNKPINFVNLFSFYTYRRIITIICSRDDSNFLIVKKATNW
jgi:hypothetical protein